MATDTDALEGPLKKVYTQYKWALIWLYGAKVYIVYTLWSISYKSSIQIIHTTRAVLLIEAEKKGPNQETGLGNMGHLKVLNDTKLVLIEHE